MKSLHFVFLVLFLLGLFQVTNAKNIHENQTHFFSNPNRISKPNKDEEPKKRMSAGLKMFIATVLSTIGYILGKRVWQHLFIGKVLVWVAWITWIYVALLALFFLFVILIFVIGLGKNSGTSFC